ncbi:MAG: thioredoxin [Proteobacteria bacterium]|nr:thioredoxin [Pseudomonadota bacterium]MDA1308735.1 thioredoxin [Pseudomonadota bacterium]
METLINGGAAASGGAGADVIKDSTTATFMADVVEASATVPVIVDFWAPWCGPCKTLGPVIEKVVREAAGAVRLVKVDIDQNPEIAQQMRVQSIPAVFAFKDGQPVDGFAGALPESKVREFIKKLTDGAAGDSPLDEALDAADEMLVQEDFQGAGGLYSQVLQHDATNIRGFAGLAKSLIALGEIEQAQKMIEDMPDDQKKAPEILAVISQLDLAAAGADVGELSDLRAAVEADPKNLDARFDLAMALYAQNDREGAVDALLESIRINRAWNEEAARKQLLKLFEVFGHTDPVTVDARKRLSSILFS